MNNHCSIRANRRRTAQTSGPHSRHTIETGSQQPAATSDRYKNASSANLRLINHLRVSIAEKLSVDDRILTTGEVQPDAKRALQTEGIFETGLLS